MKRIATDAYRLLISGPAGVLVAGALLFGLTGCYTQLATVEHERAPAEGTYERGAYESAPDRAYRETRRLYEDRYYGRISYGEYRSRLRHLSFGSMTYASPFFYDSYFYDSLYGYGFGFDPLFGSYIPETRFYLSFHFGSPFYGHHYRPYRYGFARGFYSPFFAGHYQPYDYGFYGNPYYSSGWRPYYGHRFTPSYSAQRRAQTRAVTIGRDAESRGRTYVGDGDRSVHVGRDSGVLDDRRSRSAAQRGTVGRSSEGSYTVPRRVVVPERSADRTRAERSIRTERFPSRTDRSVERRPSYRDRSPARNDDRGSVRRAPSNSDSRSSGSRVRSSSGSRSSGSSVRRSGGSDSSRSSSGTSRSSRSRGGNN